MKIISLNTFAGTFFEPLMEFIKDHAENTDIFCFQEITNTDDPITVSRGARANLFAEVSLLLSDFQGYFSPSQLHFVPTGWTPDNVEFGHAFFIRRNLEVKAIGHFFLFRERDSMVPDDPKTTPFQLQYTQLTIGETFLTICNVHGVFWPVNKLDSPERLVQSQKIIDFLQDQPGEKIICGDFNLFPNTKSIQMLEEYGLRNLIKDYHIQTTRGSLIKRLHPEYVDTPEGFQEFADYMFASSGIEVKKFEVPDVPVSDHLPMVGEFDV